MDDGRVYDLSRVRTGNGEVRAPESRSLVTALLLDAA
jgi:hypothetical protein